MKIDLSTQLDFERLEVSFPDDTRNTINIFMNRTSPEAPLFLLLPALGVRASFYKHLACSMVESCLNVVTMDWRGTGASSVAVDRHTSFGFHEIITIDIPTIVREIKNRFPQNPLYLLGHSLGGQLALLYASLDDQGIDGVVLLTGGSNYYRNLKFPHNLTRLFNYRFIQILTSIFGYFPGHLVGFAGKESRGMIKDWLRESLTGKYKIANNSNNFEITMRAVDIPVLFVTLAGDAYVSPGCANFLANKLLNAKVTTCELNAADYSLPQFSHFNWRETPEPIVDNISAWLSNNEKLITKL